MDAKTLNATETIILMEMALDAFEISWDELAKLCYSLSESEVRQLLFVALKDRFSQFEEDWNE